MLENSKVTTTVFQYFISDEMLDRKITLDTPSIDNLTSFDILIEFSSPIATFRNQDYTWVTISQDRIANDFSPKVIRLQNGLYVQANCNLGIWEVNAKKPKQLLWRFNPEFAAPITQYSNKNNTKKIVSAQTDFNFAEKLALLISTKGAVEISRSPIPFSAVACFTDHCDFDTLELLEKQRDFFKEKNIKITKGFFLNNFSKRKNNASWENDQEELIKWLEDGHELCYHSLSQSIKSPYESFSDFKSFTPPIPIATWIDHGYQPYNLSLYEKEGVSKEEYSKVLKDKNIEIFWNYIDSGTSTKTTINQLNSNDFTLRSFYRGIVSKSFKIKITLWIKNSIVHFYNDEKLIQNYTQLASSFKKTTKSKSVRAFAQFIKISLNIIQPLLMIFLFWKSYKNRVYPLAKYCPIFFEHTIGEKKIVVFQTLEMIDFITSLSKEAVDKLINEGGLFIAHTYFSVPMDYHDGRLFTDKKQINEKVNQNFTYISQQIKEDKIWNPTLKELVSYWKLFQNTKLELDSNNKIVPSSNNILPYRFIK